jgi:hypothetical protein
MPAGSLGRAKYLCNQTELLRCGRLQARAAFCRKQMALRLSRLLRSSRPGVPVSVPQGTA